MRISWRYSGATAVFLMPPVGVRARIDMGDLPPTDRETDDENL